MNRRVWKYRLMDERGVQVGTFPMPNGSRARHIGMQDGWLCLWAEVDADETLVDYSFVVVGTGHPVPPDYGTWLGSTQAGPFVWHVFGDQTLVRP